MFECKYKQCDLKSHNKARVDLEREHKLVEYYTEIFVRITDFLYYFLKRQVKEVLTVRNVRLEAMLLLQFYAFRTYILHESE